MIMKFPGSEVSNRFRITFFILCFFIVRIENLYAGESIPAPAIVVRGTQELKWGLHDHKRVILYPKKDFGSELLDNQLDIKRFLASNIHEFLWETDRLDREFDFYFDTSENKESHGYEPDFLDFDIWLGQDIRLSAD